MKYDVLKYGNDVVSALKFGSTDVSRLVTSEGDYWEPEGDTPTPTLSIGLVGIDCDNNWLYRNTLPWRRLGNSGSNSMAVRLLDGKRTSEVIPYVVSTSGSQETVVDGLKSKNTKQNVSEIDDYLFLIYRKKVIWEGGDGNNVEQGKYRFVSAQDSSVYIDIPWQSGVDENNTIMLAPELFSKAIRVPASGVTGHTDVLLYPFSFKDPTFYTESYFNVYNPLTDVLGESVTTYTATGIAASITAGSDIITRRFNYQIAANTGTSFKEYAFKITGFSTPVMLHFIQEPARRNRVYYGTGYCENWSFADEYRNTNNNQYKWHSFFEACSSKVLSGNTTISTTTQQNYLAYPNDFDYNVSISGANTTTVSSDYYWGDTSYTLIRINASTSGATITFTAK